MIVIGVEGAHQEEEEPSHHHVARGMPLPINRHINSVSREAIKEEEEVKEALKELRRSKNDAREAMKG
jgi:hypothetical protein